MCAVAAGPRDHATPICDGTSSIGTVETADPTDGKSSTSLKRRNREKRQKAKRGIVDIEADGRQQEVEDKINTSEMGASTSPQHMAAMNEKMAFLMAQNNKMKAQINSLEEKLELQKERFDEEIGGLHLKVMRLEGIFTACVHKNNPEWADTFLDEEEDTSGLTWSERMRKRGFLDSGSGTSSEETITENDTYQEMTWDAIVAEKSLEDIRGEFLSTFFDN